MKTIRRAAAIIAAALFALSLCSCARRLLGYSAMKLAGVEMPQYWAGKLEDEFEISFDALPDEWGDEDITLVGSGVHQNGGDPRGNFGYSVYRLRLPASGDEMKKRVSASPVWRALPDEALADSLKQHEIKTFALFSGEEYLLPAHGYYCAEYHAEDGKVYEIPPSGAHRSFVVGVWDADECEFYYISIENIDADTVGGDGE